MRQTIACLLLLIVGASAADKGLAGAYSGEWKSGASGNGGSIRFTLEALPGSGWKSVLTFALDGADVPTTMREVNLRDGKLELSYDFEVQGVTARSNVKGEWNGTEFRGQYETSTADGSQSVDSGTWSAKPKK